jgi:hypothetical protein
MRIAHVNFVADQSIENKLKQQAQAARKEGIPIDFIIFSPHDHRINEPSLIVLPMPGGAAGYRWSMKLQWPFRLFWAAHAVKWDRYDGIILRYPKLPLGGRYFARRTGCPIITEHHSLELQEIKGSGHFVRQCAVMLEQILRKRLMRHVSGIIGVSGEVAEAAAGQNMDKPRRAISNGVDVTATPPTGYQPFNGKDLHLFMIAGHFAPWHGLDRLLEGLLAYRGPVNIHLTLVGHIPATYEKLITECRACENIKIELTGPLYGDALNVYFARANLAVASLGEFRIGINNRPTLKVREYIARGLPFIYASGDPDLPEPCPFALRIPNDHTAVDINQAVQFALVLSIQEKISAEMRCFAEQNLDWTLKVRETYNFTVDVVTRLK